MNKRIILSFLLIFVIGLIFGIIGLKLYENNISTKSDSSIENQEEKDSNIDTKEIEINLEDYTNLHFKITSDATTSPYYIYESGKWKLRNSDFTFKDLSNSWFLENALWYIQYYTDDWENLSATTGEVERRISSKKVDEIIKLLFGKNFNYTHESTQSWEYKDGYYYVHDSKEDEPFAYYVEAVTYKTTQCNDNIYIYEAVGVREEITTGEKTSLDYYEQKDWIYDLKAVYLYDSLDLTKKVSGDFMGDPNVTTNYVANYPEQFANYRYTYTKEDNNYILTNIEKL